MVGHTRIYISLPSDETKDEAACTLHLPVRVCVQPIAAIFSQRVWVCLYMPSCTPLAWFQSILGTLVLKTCSQIVSVRYLFPAGCLCAESFGSKKHSEYPANALGMHLVTLDSGKPLMCMARYTAVGVCI